MRGWSCIGGTPYNAVDVVLPSSAESDGPAEKGAEFLLRGHGMWLVQVKGEIG